MLFSGRFIMTYNLLQNERSEKNVDFMRGTILERRKSDMVMALPVGALPIYLKRACPLSYNAWSQRL